MLSWICAQARKGTFEVRAQDGKVFVSLEVRPQVSL